jgi:hypothetical protein
MGVRAKQPIVLTLTICLMSSGCGLIVQGRSQAVHIQTTPEGATASLTGATLVTPGTLTIDRKSEWRVLRAEKPGYHPACQIVPCSVPVLLAFLDIIPGLGVSLVVDRLAGGLRQCPDALYLHLAPVAPGTEPVTLPSDSAVLDEWTEHRIDACPIPPAPVSVWAVTYDIVLTSVDRPGQPQYRYGPVERAGVLRAGDGAGEAAARQIRDLYGQTVDARWLKLRKRVTNRV